MFASLNYNPKNQWPIPSILPHAEPPPSLSPKIMVKWLHVNMTLKNNTDIGGRGRRCNLVDGPPVFLSGIVSGFFRRGW